MQSLIRLADLEASPDVNRVAEAGKVLGVRAVDVFRCAHQSWFSKPASERQLDQLMADFMLREQVPHWVRFYCRRVLTRAAEGELNLREFGVERRTVYDFTWAEQRYAAAVIAIGFLLYLLATI